MQSNQEEHILESWNQNASPWIQAIQQEEIESRTLVTNQAIIDAVLAHGPAKVLDLGCGEGWLTRKLVQAGIDALGVDGVPELVSKAQGYGIGRFRILSYADFSDKSLQETFDLVVCNFSLFGQASVASLFQNIPPILNDEGRFLVQTLHPIQACGDLLYEDGWRDGSWGGFNASFSNPAPWYFRTIESWEALFMKNGFELDRIVEPIHPDTQKPLSIIFSATL